MICRRKSTLEFLKTALNLMHHVRSHQSGRQTQKFTNKLAHIQGEILFGINPGMKINFSLLKSTRFFTTLLVFFTTFLP